MDFTIFRKNLKHLLYARGTTIREFSEGISINPATISRYLSGDRTPDLPYVVKIAEHFNVSIDWLLGLNGDQFNVMPKEVQEVANLYSLASPDDRMVVQAVLGKYREG